MLRKMMYDLRSNDAFAYGKQFGRASPLPILQFKPQSGFRHFCQRQKHHFVKQNIIIRLKRIYHFFAIGKKHHSIIYRHRADKLLFVFSEKQKRPDTKPGRKLSVLKTRNGQNFTGFACCYKIHIHHSVHLLSF